MKQIQIIGATLIILISIFSNRIMAQNVGINTTTPQNALHVKTINSGDDPLRLELLQNAVANDTSFLVCDPATGVVREVHIDSVFAQTGEWVYDPANQLIYARRALENGYDVLVTNDGDMGVGTTGPTNRMHIVAPNNPLRLEGLETDNSLTEILLTDANGVVKKGDANTVFIDTDEQQITNFNINPTSNVLTLSLEDGGTQTVNLTPYLDNTDDQQIQNFAIDGANILTLTLEDGGTQMVDLSPYLDNTDDQQIQTFAINPTTNILTLALEDGGTETIDLTPYLDNTDDQQITTFNLNPTSNVLTLTLEDGGTRTVNFSDLIDHDWYEVGTTSPPNSINDNIYTQGNVGIGTTNPTERLHVQGNQYLSGAFHKYILGNSASSYRIINNDGAGNFSIYLNSTPGTSPTYESNGPAYRTYLQAINTTNNNYRFMYASPGTSGGAITWQEGWSLNPNNGNFGIGTNSPAEKLDVEGNIELNDFLIMNGKQALRGNDNWLRLNQANQFTTGVYTPSYFRVDNRVTFNEGAGDFDFRVEGTSDTHLLFTDASTNRVSIGRNNPLDKLHLANPGANNQVGVRFEDPTATGYGGRVYFDDASNTFRMITLSDNAEVNGGLVINRDNGRVGVGTTAPSHQLHVNAANPLRLQGLQTDNGLTEVLVTNANGVIKKTDIENIAPGDDDWYEVGTTSEPDNINDNIYTQGLVGIGTNNPVSRLTINNNIAHDANFDYSDATLSIFDSNNNGGNTPNGTRDILSLTREGVGGQAFGNRAAFALGRFENVSSNARTQLDIKLTDGGFTQHNTIMSLRSNGNVGFGVTAPVARIDVNGITKSTHFEMGQSGSYFGANLFWQSGTGWTRRNAAQGGFAIRNTNGDFDLRIDDQAATPSVTTRLFVETGGNVGIGTSTPSQRLDVVGNIELDNNLFMNGKNTIQSTDNWLRLNQNSQYTSGIYTPSHFRADGNVIFNENGTNNTFRVEGDNDANLISTNGVNDRVGIGTGSPSNKLHVKGINPLRLQGLQDDNSLSEVLVTDANGVVKKTDISNIAPGDHDWYEQGTTNEPNSIDDNIYTQGNVGVGLTVPTERFEVAGGNARFSNNIYKAITNTTSSQTANYRVVNNDGSGNFMIYLNSTLGTNHQYETSGVAYRTLLAGIGATGVDNNYRFSYAAAGTAGDAISWLDGYSLDPDNGHFGIGLAEPLHKLHVNGRMMLDNGVIQRAGSAITSTSDMGLYQLNAAHMRFVSAGGRFRFFVDGASNPIGGTAAFVIRETGRVGIGTENPFTNLDVNGASGANLQLKNTGVNEGLFFRVDDNNAFITNKDNFLGNGTSGNGRLILGGATGIDLNYGNNGSVGTLGLRLLNNGNVGIGAGSPSNKLHVNATNPLRLQGLQDDNGLTEVLVTDANGVIKKTDIANIAPGDHDWYEQGTTTEPNSINDNIFTQGNVGIGTTTPSQKLDVQGTARIGERLNVGPDAGDGGNTQVRIARNFTNNGASYQLFSSATVTSPALTADRTSYGAYFRLNNNKTENIAGGFDSDGVGGTFISTNSSNSTFRNLYGIQGYADNVSNATANLGNLQGGQFRAYNASTTATIGNAFGIISEARGRGGSSGNITNAYGMRGQALPYAAQLNTAIGVQGYTYTNNGHAGDINNAYGVYGRVRVDSDDGGNITTARAGYFLTDRRAGANLMTTAYGLQVDANSAQTIFGVRVDADDAAATTNYGLYIDAKNATSNNYGIWGESGDWILSANGNGIAGGTGSHGDLILGANQEMSLFFNGTNANINTTTGDLLLNPSQNVGIGHNNPDAKLDVVGKTQTTNFQMTAGATNNYVLKSDANGNGTWSPITDFQAALMDHDWYEVGTSNAPDNINDNVFTQGNVAIGANNPTERLHVQGNQYLSGQFHKYINGTSTSSWRVVNNDGAGNFSIYLNSTIGTSPTRESAGPAFRDYLGSIGMTNNTYQFMYATPSTAGSAISWLSGWSLNPSNGNFGIGTATADAKLHVNNGDMEITDGSPTIKFEDNTSGHTDYWIHNNDGRLYFIWDEDDDGGWTGESPWPLYFEGRNSYFDGNLLTTRADLNRVGIGTANPSQLLEVAGNIEMDNNLYMNGKNALQDSGNWLRLNQSSQFTNGVYTPSHFRADGNVTFNDNGTNSTFRVEGDTDPNLIRTNGANDRVGIGTGSPSHKLHVNGTNPLRLQGLQTDNALTEVLVTDANGIVKKTDISNLASSDHDWYEVGTTNEPNSINDNIFTQGLVGIGTNSPASRLTVNHNIGLDNNFNYNESALTIFDNNNNGGNSPNGTREILTLAREGVGSQAWGNKAAFALGRYENASTNSRSQLDIKLTDGSFNQHNTIMSLRSNGHVGIGTTAPSEELDVVGRVRVSDRMRVASGQTAGRINADGADNLPGLNLNGEDNIWFDGGQVRMTTHDGFGNWSLKSGADNDDVKIGASNGAVKMRIDENGSWQLYSKNGLTNGNVISWNLGLFQNGTGRVGIGTNNPSTELQVIGNIFATGNASDRRFKKNIQTYQKSALAEVAKIETVSYEYRTDEFTEEQFPEGIQTGFIAQDLEKIVPEAVFDRADGFKGVDYGKVTPLLVKALQEQQAIIDDLQKENKALKAQKEVQHQTLESVQSRLAAIEKLVAKLTDNTTNNEQTSTK
ncbi:MAG: tail fiber domain-containing protein [Bacteroidota bacterium]